jgi:LacI family transcriptional regulator
MAEAGVAVDPAWVVASTFGIESGAEAAAALMGLDPRPTAVFAVNDNTAIGALSTFDRLGLSVPQDVSLVGYNDIPIVSRLSTPLTSVRVPFDQIATAALDLLVAGPAGEHDRVRVAPPTLIPRRSTATAPTP